MISFALFAVLGQSAPPLVLISQQLAPVEGERDVNVKWADALAESLVQKGKVKPIVWSKTDPTVRQWIDNRTVDFEDPVTTDGLMTAARKVGATYVIIISGLRAESGSVTGAIMLFRPPSSRPIWTDTKQFEVQGSIENTTMTFGSTWAAILSEGQFRGLRTVTPPSTQPPTETKPPIEVKPDTPVQPPQVADSSRALQQAEDQARKGLIDEAILTLREAIDENPVDPAPRAALVRLYTAAGRHEEAANEAQRLAGLGLDSKGYHLAAAEMWLEIGRPIDAQNALNEHKARAGESPESQVVQGRVWLAQDQLGRANDAFQASADKKVSEDAMLGLAVVAAMQGQEDLAKMQLEECRKLGTSTSLMSYRWAMRAVDQRLDLFSEQFREVMRFATAKPGEPQTLARAAKIESISRSLSALMEGVIPPNNHSASHERRRLAHKLLVQAAAECGTYARSGQEQDGENANLSFGEALRQLPLARESMQREIAGK
jgi:hypothetical protein